MSEDLKEGRSFIHERIVPRKNYKKVILVIAGTIGVAVLFGAIAGLTFFVSQNVLGANSETPAPAIIIARDDTAEEETVTVTEAEETEEPETQTEEETEPSETAESTETEETEAESGASGEDETGEGETGSSEAVTETETAETTAAHTEPVHDIHTVYEEVYPAFVPVLITRSGGTDSFDSQILNRDESFAVLVAQTATMAFALTAYQEGMEEAAITLNVNDTAVQGELYQKDLLKNLCVIKIEKDGIKGEIQTIQLGNSINLGVAEDVYMIGAPMGQILGVDAGIVTYYASCVDTTDGYEQLFYTNMTRMPGGTAALLNKYGQMIGWVSDGSCGAEKTTVIAYGISPLKYLIEDMCSGADTAYLGVNCVLVRDMDEALLNIPAGLYVREVVPDSPAYAAGIQTGDRITGMNGKNIIDSHTLQICMDRLKPGSEATVEIMRYNGAEYVPMTVTAVTDSR